MLAGGSHSQRSLCWRETSQKYANFMAALAMDPRICLPTRAANQSERASDLANFLSTSPRPGYTLHPTRRCTVVEKTSSETHASRDNMDDLEDELDLRYHRGLKPDVYYRCPTLEVCTYT